MKWHVGINCVLMFNVIILPEGVQTFALDTIRAGIKATYWIVLLFDICLHGVLSVHHFFYRKELHQFRFSASLLSTEWLWWFKTSSQWSIFFFFFFSLKASTKWKICPNSYFTHSTQCSANTGKIIYIYYRRYSSGCFSNLFFFFCSTPGPAFFRTCFTLSCCSFFAHTCFKNVWKNGIPSTDTLTLPCLHLLQTFQCESLSTDSLLERSLNVKDMLCKISLTDWCWVSQ